MAVPDSVVPLSQRFADTLNEKFQSARFPSAISATTLNARFDRIVVKSYFATPRSDGSVYAFVERETGLLFKAESWRVPAEEAQFDLENNFAHIITIADADARFINYSLAAEQKRNREFSKYVMRELEELVPYKAWNNDKLAVI
jgi:hypothetical protein